MSSLVVFDRFSLDKRSRRLFAGSEAIPVSTPGLRLLLALLDQPGEIISKDALIAQVWGSAAITENALHVQVAALRRAIGSHLIITQSGVGYKFVGQVKQRAGPRAPTAAKQPRAIPARTLLGRDAQLQELETALTRHLFVTLTGPGGVGKTSLARALCAAQAAAFPDGVFWCELAALRDQAGLADTVKAALDLEGASNTPPLAAVLTRLHGKRALLVLDNCEHLLPGAASLADALFGGAPGLAILVTSRQALGCAAEYVAPVPTLALPAPDVATLKLARRSPAFRLFLDKILALDPGFTVAPEEVPIAARICRSLDGLPLALEIVASWAGVLGLETLETKLNTAPFSWAHARKTATARHYDLKTALGWSFDLLSGSEQALLRRVSVFAQDFSLRAAEQVAAGDVLPEADIFTDLASLVEKSLVCVVPATRPPTYRLLETTRGFAQEKLREAGEEEALRRRHAAHVLQVLGEAETAWDRLGTKPWLGLYAGVLNDVRAALDWSLFQAAEPQLGVAIAASSWPLWRETSLRTEGATWLEAALRRSHADTPVAVQARLHHGLGLMHGENNLDAARAAFTQAAVLFGTAGDRKGQGAALQHLAFIQFLLGDIDGAEQATSQGWTLLQGTESQRGLASALDVRLVLASHRGNYQAAREAGRQAVQLYDSMGAHRSAFTARSNLIDVALCQNDVAGAIQEARALAAELRLTSLGGVLGFVLINFVAALVRDRQFEAALDRALEAAPLLAGHRPLFVLIDHLALRCALLGRLEDAATLGGFADAAYAKLGWPRQHVEQHAADLLRENLAKALRPDAAARLAAHGAMMGESAAWAIATRPCSEGAERQLYHAAE